MPGPLALTLGMCTLLTQTSCLMCNTQELLLNDNQIGDKGLEAFAQTIKRVIRVRDTNALRIPIGMHSALG